MAEGRITYQEIKEELADRLELSISESDELIKDFISMIQLGLERDEEVYIPKFGTFELQYVAERAGTNPQTGEKITIEAHKKVVFKPRKALRNKVNKKYKNLASYPVKDNREPVKQKLTPWVWGVLGMLLMIGGIAYYESVNDTSYLDYEKQLTASQDTSALKMSMISEDTRIIDVTQFDAYDMQGRNHLYQLARELYQDPKFWPLIYFANYTKLHNPDRLPVLKQMKIYDVDTTKSELSQKDKKMMSMAYGVVSRSYYMHGNRRQYNAYKKRAEEFYKF